jgi:hypothetical protein
MARHRLRVTYFSPNRIRWIRAWHGLSDSLYDHVNGVSGESLYITLETKACFAG